MSRRALAVVLATATCAAGAAHAGPWDEIAHPHRRRCAQLVDEASKRSDAREWKAAMLAARSAVTLCPSDRVVLLRAGETLLGGREYGEALVHLERARALADRTPGTREQELALAFHLGFAREVTGDLEGAIVEHRRLEAMGGLATPNQYLVHYNLGDELMATGRLGEAIEEYRRAVALSPARPVVRLALAVALDRDERIDQSRVELSGVLALDPELRNLAAEDYVFVPAADVHYYRALALLERGSTAEARLAMRTFIAILPSGPYAAHARERLTEAEQRVDARELEVSGVGIDTPSIARALGPVVGALEDCLAPHKVVRIRLEVGHGSLRADAKHPAAECFNGALSRVDAALLATLDTGSVTVPLAGRRGAASPP
ncbi:MAG: Tetratricopeptide 2 repeat protein [bacterium]|nr:Tetratricopeptide 2 repeat protein [bacterium]